MWIGGTLSRSECINRTGPSITIANSSWLKPRMVLMLLKRSLRRVTLGMAGNIPYCPKGRFRDGSEDDGEGTQLQRRTGNDKDR